MKTAQEAKIEALQNREKINTQQFNQILASITKAISEGKTSVIIPRSISKESVDRLRKADYVLQFPDSRDNTDWVRIDWSNADYPIGVNTEKN